MDSSKILLSAFALFVSISSLGDLLPDEKNNIEVYQKYGPAVVNITATTLRRDFFYEVYPQKGLGSGLIIRPEGYVLTNEHVIGNAVEVEVTLSDKSHFPAKVIGRDPDSDLAVLKIDAKGKKLATIDFGDWEKLAVGQKVLAIGNPFGLGGSLTVGVISSLGRDIRASGESAIIKDVIQTDAAINPGNSGGPLLDSSGKLIGVNAQIFSRSGGSEGIGFAISVKTLKKVVPELIQFGRVLRPWLGIEAVEMPAQVLQSLNVPSQHGVMLVGVYKGSPAEKSGLRPATKEVLYGFRTLPYGGDVIYQIDQTPIMRFRDIVDLLAEKKNGDKVTIQYFRGATKREVEVRLAVPRDSNTQSL